MKVSINRILNLDGTWQGYKLTPLTNALEAYFQKVNKPYEFRLAPLKGELYIITIEEVASPPPKKFNIYGDY